MLIDTGSQISYLDSVIAESLDLAESDMVSVARGVAGIQLVPHYAGVLHLPEWNVSRHLNFGVIPLRDPLGVIAIIGMNFLMEFVLTIHGPNRTVTLAQP